MNPDPNKPLDLTHAQLIGQGTHKKCFCFPNKPHLCVKVAYNTLGQTDLKREIVYLNTAWRRTHPSCCLPRFYGTIQTTMGQGYVLEYICNPDGRPCIDLQHWLRSGHKNSQLDKRVTNAITEFKKTLFKDEIVTMSIWPENIVLQPKQNKLQAFCMNDLGSAAMLPLVYWIPYLRRKHIQRRWKQFFEHVKKIVHPTKRHLIENWK